MRRNLSQILITLILGIIITACTLPVNTSSAISPTPSIPSQAGDIIEFEGTLTDFNSACEIDISCIATVDNYQITTNPGDVGGPIALGKSDVWSPDIGKRVKVRAQVVEGNQLTLVGNDQLYVLKIE